MFESWIISPHSISPKGREEATKQIRLNYTKKTYKKLKKVYIKHYKKLINIYLEKQDAWIFLRDYTSKNKDWYYLPKNDEIRDFVEYYYWIYKEIGNQIDDNVSKKDYI